MGGRWDIERLQYSATAKRLGVDNTIPPDLLPKARGLVVVANRAESLGIRVNSGYRSRALTEAIYADRKPPQTPPYSGPGDHGKCEGLDFDKIPGYDGDELLREVEQTLRADSVIGPTIRYTLKEGDHLHVGFKGDKLVELGKSSVNVA